MHSEGIVYKKCRKQATMGTTRQLPIMGKRRDVVSKWEPTFTERVYPTRQVSGSFLHVPEENLGWGMEKGEGEGVSGGQ